ncbi:luciferin 4-monooxygenase-like [Phlebotomus argentipes]|uniref:luciferin 4-monooxygenase-like n=1 Tax=Phlebotomus argentipes TaxID=94469 RepID=UPI00289346AD|nr:luciferin 4-monooxygenase-like [Phlebotomus argentipes]
MNNIFKSTIFDEKTKIWRGSHRPIIFDPSISLGRAILFVLNRNPDFVAQISDNSGVRKTNREIHDATLKIAVNLQKIGCARGDVVGFVCRNHENLAPAVLASYLIAAPVNALDFMFSKDEIIHMFGITRPKFVFCEKDKFNVLKDALNVLKSDAKIILMDEKVSGFLHMENLLEESADLEDFCPPDVDDKTCAVILCSSGTTGMPKGVSLTHRHLQFVGSYGFFDDVLTPCSMICFSSLYWYSGLATLLTTSLMGITRIITTDPYTPDLFYSMLTKYRPEFIFSAPVQLSDILSHQLLDENTLQSVKCYICAGSTVHEPLWEKAKKYLTNGDIYNGYGMSEVGFISREPVKTPRYSVGKLIAGLEMKIIDENGEQLGIGQEGEFCMRTKDMFLCYYNNPEETVKILDKDGWVHSGDVGYLDEDGLLHIIGRNKDILKYNNYVVSPVEVENLILTIPGVLQVSVVGVPHPTHIDLPAAVVVRKMDSSVTEAEICSVVEKRLSDSKRLRGGVYFVDSLPLTPSGKVRKNIVKEMAKKFYNERNV